MIAICEYRVQADRCVEISLGSAEVTKVVLCDSAIEKGPAVGGIEPGQYVEMGYRV